MLCWVEIAKSKCRSFDSSAFSGLAQDDSAMEGFVLSHPSDKNKSVARVGHPVFVLGWK
jgi:hypothetical protein